MGWWSDKITGQPSSQYTAPPPPMYAQPQPQAVPQQPQQQMAQPPPQDGVEVPVGHVRAGEAWQQWGGGQAVKTEQTPCPSCGGGNYFSRVNTAGLSRNGPPAPTCFDCGYPIVQFGSPTGAGGDTQTVRQGAGAGEVEGKAREAPSFATGAHLDQIIAKVN